jgi:hypothetical protein
MLSTSYPVCLECRERFAHTRGLCRRCYGRLAAAVRAGKAMWQQLEGEGRCLALAPKGGTHWGARRRAAE